MDLYSISNLDTHSNNPLSCMVTVTAVIFDGRRYFFDHTLYLITLFLLIPLTF